MATTDTSKTSDARQRLDDRLSRLNASQERFSRAVASGDAMINEKPYPDYDAEARATLEDFDYWTGVPKINAAKINAAKSRAVTRRARRLHLWQAAKSVCFGAATLACVWGVLTGPDAADPAFSLLHLLLWIAGIVAFGAMWVGTGEK